MSREVKDYILEHSPADMRELFIAQFKRESLLDDDDEVEARTLEDFKEYPMFPSNGLDKCHICGLSLLSIMLIADLVFCPEHAAPYSHTLRNLNSNFCPQKEERNIILCFGKPVCVACYEESYCDNQCKTKGSLDVPEEFSLWISCHCHKIFICHQCFDDAEYQECQINRIDLDQKPDMTDRDDDGDDESMESDEDLREFYINTIDWTESLFAELGIHPQSHLSRMIFRFIDNTSLTPARVFDMLDTVLTEDLTLLQLLNNTPISDDKKDPDSLEDKNECHKSEIDPGYHEMDVDAIMLEETAQKIESDSNLNKVRDFKSVRLEDNDGNHND